MNARAGQAVGEQLVALAADRGRPRSSPPMTCSPSACSRRSCARVCGCRTISPWSATTTSTSRRPPPSPLVGPPARRRDGPPGRRAAARGDRRRRRLRDRAGRLRARARGPGVDRRIGARRVGYWSRERDFGDDADNPELGPEAVMSTQAPSADTDVNGPQPDLKRVMGPRLAAATGPASTGRPVRSAVSRQSRAFCAPPPTTWTSVSRRPDSEAAASRVRAKAAARLSRIARTVSAGEPGHRQARPRRRPRRSGRPSAPAAGTAGRRDRRPRPGPRPRPPRRAGSAGRRAAPATPSPGSTR